MGCVGYMLTQPCPMARRVPPPGVGGGDKLAPCMAAGLEAVGAPAAEEGKQPQLQRLLHALGARFVWLDTAMRSGGFEEQMVAAAAAAAAAPAPLPEASEERPAVVHLAELVWYVLASAHQCAHES